MGRFPLRKLIFGFYFFGVPTFWLSHLPPGNGDDDAADAKRRGGSPRIDRTRWDEREKLDKCKMGKEGFVRVRNARGAHAYTRAVLLRLAVSRRGYRVGFFWFYALKLFLFHLRGQLSLLLS